MVDKVNVETSRALNDKDTLEALQTAGMTPIGGTPDQMRALLQKDTRRWAEVVKAPGAKID